MEWVVTYRIAMTECDFLVEEFFRGEYDECMRIKQHSMSGGESDQTRTARPWYPAVGPANEWDEMVEGVNNG